MKNSLIRVVTIAAACAGVHMGSAMAASDKCPDVNGIASKQTSAIVFEQFAADSSTGTVTYYFMGLDPANPSVDGIPGLISYCVYPDGANLPNSIAVDSTGAVGADGTLFKALMSAKGSFSFTRGGGNPTNLPFDGVTHTMGTATWTTACVTDLITQTQTCDSPSKQTILVHINDATECANLYGAGSSDTCWVFPTPLDNRPPPPPLCNGEPACKSAVIDEASGAFDGSGYPIVPLNTLLHIHYTYVIVNQNAAGSGIDMIFNPPTSKTQDINSGGGKDYFGCEQTPDPAGSPGSWKDPFVNYQNTNFTFHFVNASGNNCPQSRFFMNAPTQIILHPGDTVTFTVDMITRTNKGGKQEYTSAGPHILNSGFTVKWFQPSASSTCPGWVNSKTLCSYSTGITPLQVDAQP